MQEQVWAHFFSKKAFILAATALGFAFAGGVWRQVAVEKGGDQLNGWVLIAIGAIIACWMIYMNINNTNIAYGLGGSIGQIGIFSVLAWFSLLLVILFIMLQIFAAMAASNSYRVRR